MKAIHSDVIYNILCTLSVHHFNFTETNDIHKVKCHFLVATGSILNGLEKLFLRNLLFIKLVIKSFFGKIYKNNSGINVFKSSAYAKEEKH